MSIDSPAISQGVNLAIFLTLLLCLINFHANKVTVLINANSSSSMSILSTRLLVLSPEYLSLQLLYVPL